MGTALIIGTVAICTVVGYISYEKYKESHDFLETQETEVETGQTHESGGAEPL